MESQNPANLQLLREKEKLLRVVTAALESGAAIPNDILMDEGGFEGQEVLDETVEGDKPELAQQVRALRCSAQALQAMTQSQESSSVALPLNSKSSAALAAENRQLIEALDTLSARLQQQHQQLEERQQELDAGKKEHQKLLLDFQHCRSRQEQSDKQLSTVEVRKFCFACVRFFFQS